MNKETLEVECEWTIYKRPFECNRRHSPMRAPYTIGRIDVFECSGQRCAFNFFDTSMHHISVDIVVSREMCSIPPFTKWWNTESRGIFKSWLEFKGQQSVKFNVYFKSLYQFKADIPEIFHIFAWDCTFCTYCYFVNQWLILKKGVSPIEVFAVRFA